MSGSVLIRTAEPADLEGWARMRHALWPHSPLDEHRAEAARFFADELHEPMEVLLAFRDAKLVGFAELSIRNVVDGCTTDRVGYLEGWYVETDARRQGVGAALVAAAERWALEQGCTEFGSDVELDNTISHEAHRALGFEETGRIVTYRKDLKPEEPGTQS